MSPSVFHARLAAIGWSQRALALRLNINETRVRRWAAGVYPIPEAIAGWLDHLATAHEERPLPEEWEAGRSKAHHTECAARRAG